MNIMTYSNAKNNLAKTIEKVCADHSPVVITGKDTQSVVIISLEDYNSLEETAYLLRSPKNTGRLLASVAEFQSGGGTERKLVE